MSCANPPLGNLYDAQAQDYAAHRPTYPDAVYEAIYAFGGLGQKQLAVDVGCGSGQCCARLSQDFGQVIGIDASAAQLQQAVARPNITYRLGPAEDTGLPNQSVDLVTAATCLHWLDAPAFYREARRILRPTGVLAVWTYLKASSIQFPSNGAASQALERVEQRVNKYFHPKLQRFLCSAYEGLEPTAGDFQVVQTQGASMDVELTVGQVLGLVRSWSCYTTFIEKEGEASMAQLLQTLERELLEALGVPNARTSVHTVWPLTIVLAKQPVTLGERDSSAGGAG